MQLLLDEAPAFLEAMPATRPDSHAVMPLQHASRAYRTAGGEPPHHSPAPRLFSIRA